MILKVILMVILMATMIITIVSPKRRGFLVVAEHQYVDPPKNGLTLASLLEVFDGVMEMPGRMMVITTNHPEKLDKALIRPGRIDLNLEFGKCTSRDVADIYKNFYNKEVDLETEEILDGVWTYFWSFF